MSGSAQIPWEKKPWRHGKAIVNGELRFLSVSQLEKANASGSEGCLRAWFYDKKIGIKEPESKHLERGNVAHAEVAGYLTTGQRGHLSSLVLSGLHQIPTPGDDLLVEHDLVPDKLDTAIVRVAGIPLTGSIDVCHARPENYGVQDIRDAVDEPGVIKVIDHKFPSTTNNAKSAADLPNTFQMAGYAVWVYAAMSDTKRVRLTHNIIPVKGTPRAPTILVDRDDVEATWKQMNAVGVSMRDAARETNPDKIDANTRACRAYGRDCPAMHLCRAVQHNSLASLVGSAADRILPRHSLPVIQNDEHMTTPVAPNNLFAKLQAAKAQTAAPAPPDQVAAEVERLQKIEAAATASPPNPLLALIDEIASYGFGIPQFNGQAARDVAAAKGISISPGAGLAGAGEMGQHAVDDVSVLPTILAGVQELAEIRKNQPPAEQVPVADKVETEVEAEKPKKRGRKKKAETEATHATEAASGGAQMTTTVTITEPVTLSPAPDAVQEAPKPAPTPQPPGAINVYVDVAVEGLELTSIWPIVHYIQQNMNHDAAACEEGVSDFRTSMQKDSRYAFGKWPGILAAALRQCPAEGYMPPGNYRLDGSMGQIGGVVCETMREIALATGGVFVKGAR